MGDGWTKFIFHVLLIELSQEISGSKITMIGFFFLFFIGPLFSFSSRPCVDGFLPCITCTPIPK